MQGSSYESSVDDERVREMVRLYFGTQPEDALSSILSELERVWVPGGEWLFHAGDEGTSLFLVARGRLQVWSEPDAAADGSEPHLLGELGPGETLGEVGLLAGGTRSASVRAIRDSLLLRMDRETFERLAAAHPSLALELAAQVARRLRDRTSRTRSVARGPENFTMIALGDGTSLTGIAEELSEALATHGTTRRVGIGELHRSGVSSPSEWLDELESKSDYLLLETEPNPSPWSEICLRHADAFLLFANAADRPSLGPFGEVAGEGTGLAKRLLVLLHDGESISHGADWRRVVRPDEIYHVRSTSRARDVARLARILAGRAIGLVLGGGAARGLAHIGVYRALCEAEIPVDWVGGASIGSVFAAAMAHDWSPDEVEAIAREAFVQKKPFGDYTIPLVALLRGKRVQRLVKQYFDLDIEDLPVPYFCVSSHLDRGEIAVHESGHLWQAVRASIALPGVLPPAVVDRHLAIDGGVLNNLPVDVMRARRVGRVVAVDLSAREDRAVQFEEFPSALQILRKRLFPFVRAPGVPNIFTLMIKASFVSSAAHSQAVRGLADLLLEPPVSRFGLLDVKAFDELVQVGYEHTRSRLETEWKLVGT
ncbi:MAG: patatin-like phospholipase family protein [Deltaproteobacteria bacterium]|nr:patatin-like phospholipase family protein [Deltaproteobacteria bacterium]MBW2501121.1 patatin-like phospholipase family protein [Deltaproteobacteria bacterium]